MNGVEAISSALETTKALLNHFVHDFTDADLLVRPVPGANHTAWQIGNVIFGDIFLIRGEFSNATYPDLPAGFLDQHGPKGSGDDNPKHFLSKAEYMGMLDKVRAATIAELRKLSDADLDRMITGPMKRIAPNIGMLFQAASDHTLMHTGQFSVIRRKLGKPVLF